MNEKEEYEEERREEEEEGGDEAGFDVRGKGGGISDLG